MAIPAAHGPQGGNPEEKQQGLTGTPYAEGNTPALTAPGRKRAASGETDCLNGEVFHPAFISPIQGDVPRPNPHQG